MNKQQFPTYFIKKSDAEFFRVTCPSARGNVSQVRFAHGEEEIKVCYNRQVIPDNIKAEISKQLTAWNSVNCQKAQCQISQANF